MLPHEAEVMADIGQKYRAQLEAMTALHDAVVSMMTAGSWTVRKSYAARELLWAASSRIDDRLGLGFSATLAPHKLTRMDIEKGHK